MESVLHIVLSLLLSIVIAVCWLWSECTRTTARGAYSLCPLCGFPELNSSLLDFSFKPSVFVQ